MKRTTRKLINAAKHTRWVIAQTHGKYFQDATADIAAARKRQAQRYRENRKSMGGKRLRDSIIKSRH